MATERDFELLDDYLSNKLGGQDKADFEAKLKADSELTSELRIQQQLIEGIQKARVKELKAMLNNVPVPPVSPGTSMLTKFAVGTIFVGAVATGIYLLNKDKEETKQDEKPLMTTTQEPVQSEPSQELSQETKSIQEEETVSATDNSQVTTKSDTKQQQTKKSTTKQPVIEVFDPTEDSEGTEAHVDNAEAEPDLIGKAEPSIAVSIDKFNKVYNFNYQFKDGKLFLYGPFEANLYEIMEFFSGSQRTIFLHYKDDYYLLKELDSSIRPLTKVTDPVLLQKLQESNKQN